MRSMIFNKDQFELLIFYITLVVFALETVLVQCYRYCTSKNSPRRKILAEGVLWKAVYWQVAQATDITNVLFKMSTVPGNKHRGIYITTGAGEFMEDLEFEGGQYGMQLGGQQFTPRNITFNNVDTAIYVSNDNAWTFKGIKVNNCKTAIDMTANILGVQTVGSVLLMDSHITNTEVGIKTQTTSTTLPKTSGTLILDNVRIQNVTKAVAHLNGEVLLAGGSRLIKSWGQGRFYDGQGNGQFQQGHLKYPIKSAVLMAKRGKKFFERSKPSYLDVAIGDFVSVKSEGAKGDGRTDDTKAIANAIAKYAGCKVIYFPHGTYVVTDTVFVPSGSRLTGEIWSVISAKGSQFNDQNNPKPVFKIGNPGERGVAELSELLFSNQGPVPGAIMVQINIRDSAGQKGMVGLWSVPFRIGGAKGTLQQFNDCPRGRPILQSECVGAFLMLHIAPTASAYLANVWAWTADHDLDGPGVSQISIYNGRGILSESANGPVWMYGTASEHSVLYQYNVVNSKNVLQAMIQTETPYFQSNPPAPKPFTSNATYNDPDFNFCPAFRITCPMAWALPIEQSENIYVYGAQLNSFSNNYVLLCQIPEHCQDYIVSIEKSVRNVYIFNLNTRNSKSMVSINGTSVVMQRDNRNNLFSTIARFRILVNNFI